MMEDQTTRFELKMDKADTVKNIITEVLQALEERGYNPINQLSGYLLSGDPT